MVEPVFGLLVKPRPYQCQIADCLHTHMVSTNHTDNCFSVCPRCNWRGGFTVTGTYYNAQEKERPHKYVGGPVSEDEYNPHAKGSSNE